MRVFYDRDADLNLIKNSRITIIGYGSQGHAHALNLRDSGAKNITIALREDSKSAAKAKADGFAVTEAQKAVGEADIVMVLIPDELQPQLYREHLAKGMKKGAALAFAHGFSVHFKLIEPRSDLDVFMVAPKGPGHTVRAQYLGGGGVPCLLAIAHDPSKRAESLGLAYASAIGGGRAGIISTTFKEECETDLFGEQAVLCGGLVALIEAGYETLVDAGYAPEMAYFECLHEVKLIVDLIYEGGIANMFYSVSNTAEYGAYANGRRVVGESGRRAMRKILDEIRSGKFAKDWVLENRAGRPHFLAERRRQGERNIEQVGKKLRGMMPWIAAGRLVDRKKN